MEALALLGTNSEITLYSTEQPAAVTVNGEPVHYRISPLTGNRLRIFLDRSLSAFDRILLEMSGTACPVFPGEILNTPDYFYEGPLGYVIGEAEIDFHVWAPGPHRVFLEIYKLENLVEPFADIVMEHDEKGVWTASVNVDTLGSAYRYRIERFDKSVFSTDPYAPACTVNSGYSYLLDIARTSPTDWNNDHGPHMDSPVDAVLYEAHISDLTESLSSRTLPRRKYVSVESHCSDPLGGTTILDHAVELGVTHIHLLPFQDFQSLDEKGDGFNWGYDPVLYSVPEGVYSTNPEVPETRILETKQMIQRIHHSGLGIVMDVAYNHTYNLNSPYQKLVPYYYYRLTEYGTLSNGSGTGNELATEKHMVRRFIVDSLRLWLREYHVDGFRFDLMGLIGVETMKFIVSSLKTMKQDVLLYGEPWMAGPSSMKDFPFFKGCQAGMDVAVFNDNIRNCLKGLPDDDSTGFISGAKGKELDVCRAVAGETPFNPIIRGFSTEPRETINYCSAHDNLTLIDKIFKSNPNLTFSQMKKMAALACTVVLTSQGIPFVHAGTEFLRSKFMERDSYNMGYPINEFNYLRKFFYKDFHDYISGLIHLRRAEPLLRLKSADEIRKKLSFLRADSGVVAFKLTGKDRELLVIYNSNRIPVTLEVQGVWNIIAHDCKIQFGGLFKSSNTITVQPISASIAIKG